MTPLCRQAGITDGSKLKSAGFSNFDDVDTLVKASSPGLRRYSIARRISETTALLRLLYVLVIVQNVRKSLYPFFIFFF
jgi:hypothetical protein